MKPDTAENPTPIASYREKDMFGVRRLDLFEGCVVSTGKNPGVSDHNIVVPFDFLEPTISRIGSRGQGQLLGIGMIAGGIALAVSWAKYSQVHTYPGFWVGVTFAALGLYCVLRSFRRIEMAVFYTSAGICVLGIRRTGPDVARYEEFVQQVSRQIAKHRARIFS